MNPLGAKKKKSGKRSNWVRLVSIIGIYLVITVAIAYVVGAFSDGWGGGWFGGNVKDVPLSQVVTDVKDNKVKTIEVSGDELTVTYKDGTKAKSQKENSSIYEVLNNAGITDPSSLDTKIEVKTSFFDGAWGALLVNALPIIIMILFFLFIFKQAGKTGGGVFDFGKSNARLFSKDQSKVTFKDAAGVDEAIDELEEVVDFLRNPGKYRKLGARIPAGILLIGPAGTGKTLLARAVANEAKVPFFSMAGSEFMEMLVGVGASRVRDLFKKAKENAPALIFIDEIDTIGRQRGRAMVSSNGEQEQTLNQILVEMDGFSPNDNVIVIAATNRPDLLDSALTRPGRFDRQVVLQLPDIKGREDILKVHSKNKPLAEDVDLMQIAKMTVGFSGAELENMLNEAAISAAATGKHEISNIEVRDAITKVKLGVERRHIQSEEDKRMTAYHEAGHAIVAKRLPGMDSVHRISIVSRGLALGFTEINPDVDKSHQTQKDLLNRITALLGGRAAEELIFKDRTAGAGSDLERASSIAYKMVSELGMSNLGPTAFTYESNRKNPLASGQYSQKTAAQIDDEVKRIVDDSHKHAQEIIAKDVKLLDEVVSVLMKEETIEQEDFDKIVAEYDKEQ